MIQTTFIQKIIITSKNMTNERTVNRIDDKRLKRSKINYHLGNFQARNIERAMQNLIFELFFKVRSYIDHINALENNIFLWEKKIFL